MYIDFDKIKSGISGYSSYDNEVKVSVDEFLQKAIYAEGVSDGKKRGRKLEKIDITIEMLRNNIPVEKITQYTKLNISEINNIKKEINLI